MENVSAYHRAYEIICKQAGCNEIRVHPISDHTFNMFCVNDVYSCMMYINNKHICFNKLPDCEESIAKFLLDNAKTSDITLFDYFYDKYVIVLHKGQTLEQLIVEEDLNGR